MPAPSPTTATSDLATFSIKAGGMVIDQKYEILSVQVERAVNRIPSAQFVVRDGSAADESFLAGASADFAPGAKIQILAGYHDKNTAIFSGLVIKTAIQHTRGGNSSLAVTCRDAAVAMTIGRHNACYTATTDGDVMRSLISGYSALSGNVASTQGQLEEITQFSATDWDFLLARAEANGMVVIVTDGAVAVKAPAFSSSPVLTATYGLDLFDVALEEDARTQLSSVACASWDPSSQALVTSSDTIRNSNPLGSDSSPALAQVTGSAPFQLYTTAPLKSSVLKTWADAQLLKSALAKIRGTVRFQGSTLVAPDTTLALAGLGERFDGNGYVSGVRHEIRSGDWTTEVTIGLDVAWFAARPDVTVPAAHAQLPGVPGLQIGTVKQIHQDPQDEFRVLVTVPIIDNTGKGLWARLARPYGTNNAGHYFYPEVGDEVVLAFLDADPRFPVIVGSLFSSSRPPPYTPDEQNTTKAIVTNSQLKVIFDEKKKVITLVTPAANTIVISDDDKSILLQDQNGNSAKLSSAGIALSSVKDVTITAAQNITLTAQSGKLTAKGTQGVSVSGLTVALSADTEFTAAGNASAALTSSGETKVQGTVVMIN